MVGTPLILPTSIGCPCQQSEGTVVGQAARRLGDAINTENGASRGHLDVKLLLVAVKHDFHFHHDTDDGYGRVPR